MSISNKIQKEIHEHNLQYGSFIAREFENNQKNCLENEVLKDLPPYNDSKEVSVINNKMTTENFLKNIIHTANMYRGEGFELKYVTICKEWEVMFEEYMEEKQDEYICAGMKVCFSEQLNKEDVVVGLNQFV